MARTVDADILTEIPKSQIQVALLCEMDFGSGFVRLWNGLGDLVFDGDTFSGVGYLGEIAPITESGQAVRANGLTLQLSGIPSALLSIALAEDYQGRSAKVWLGFFSTSWALIECLLLFSGRMDVMQIDEGPESSTITVSVENHLADLKRARIRRYTDADQQAFYPGDRGFEFVESLQNVDIAWGPGSGVGTYTAPPVASSASGGRGSGQSYASDGGGGSGGRGDTGDAPGGGQTGSGQGGEGTGGSGHGGSGVA